MSTEEVKVKYGLSNVYVVPRTVADSKVTYGTPLHIPGAVSLSTSRDTSQNIFYADNSSYFVTNSKNSMSADLEVADIPRDVLLKYLGYVEDKNGGILETNTAVTPSFALLFQIETDVQNRRVALFNCTAVESDEDNNTEEDSIEPSTSKLTLTIKGDQLSSGKVAFRKVVEPSDTDYGTFFTTVTAPEEKTASTGA